MPGPDGGVRTAGSARARNRWAPLVIGGNVPTNRVVELGTQGEL